MKVSVISTIKNEEKNIAVFLESLLKQTRMPEEIIIVDGGSYDNTYEILKEYSKKYPQIKVYRLEGANIAKGRNYAIDKSKGEIIFTADSSTYFEKNWVKKIMKGFEQGADVVFGKYLIKKTDNLIEIFLISRLPCWKKIDATTFMPSNRNSAFRKTVWKSVGGFPEHIKRADDNWFHSRAHRLGFKYKFIPKAKVYWQLERNLKSMLKLAYLDSKSEGFSGLFKERKIYFVELLLLFIGIGILIFSLIYSLKILLISISLLILLLIFALTPYLNRKIKNIKISFIGAFLFLLLYFAHTLGLIAGIIQKRYKKNE
jgi:glycosyltransferase involved in cell wall biosynthesis